MIIRKGSRGEAVKSCQTLLSQHGYPCVSDGVFGAGTELVVLRFQRDHGLPADGIVGAATWAALGAPTSGSVSAPHPLPLVLQHIEKLGHRTLWQGDYHLNLFGIRASTRQANSFDDTLGCAYTVQGMWRVHYWPGTTDPGSFYLTNKAKWLNSKGVGVLAPGQYINVWRIDLHGGKYEALCQRNGAVSFYRDANLDSTIDFDPATLTSSSSVGANIHASSSNPYHLDVDRNKVDAWSALCQVHASTKGFREMMDLARQQVDHLGLDTFTYTLLDAW